jgi:hypothetical protein
MCRCMCTVIVCKAAALASGPGVSPRAQELAALLNEGVYDMAVLEQKGWVTKLMYEDEVRQGVGTGGPREPCGRKQGQNQGACPGRSHTQRGLPP